MKQMVTEMALNLKHKKKVLREELLPDLEVRMKAMIDKTMKEYEERMKAQKVAEDKFGFLTDVRKKLNEYVEAVGEIHISERNNDNVVVDIVGKRNQ
jgi:hypothetical protein